MGIFLYKQSNLTRNIYYSFDDFSSSYSEIWLNLLAYMFNSDKSILQTSWPPTAEFESVSLLEEAG